MISYLLKISGSSDWPDALVSETSRRPCLCLCERDRTRKLDCKLVGECPCQHARTYGRTSGKLNATVRPSCEPQESKEFTNT